MKTIILDYHVKALIENSFCRNWELCKYEIGKFLRKTGSDLAKKRREYEHCVVSRLSLLSGHQSLSEEDRKEYMKLQNELDNIYRIKAEGASIRSRVKWMEEGEQNSAYFFRLEKRKSRLSSISQLDINGEITNDAKKISMFCTDFYSNLYSSRYSEETVKYFLKSIKNCKKISDSDRQSCDYDISTNEIKRCIKNFKNNKSPGNDGLLVRKSFTRVL